MNKLATLIADVLKKIGIFKGINSQKFTIVAGTVASILYWSTESFRMGLPTAVICTGIVSVSGLAAFYVWRQSNLDHADKLLTPPPLPEEIPEPKTKAKRKT